MILRSDAIHGCGPECNFSATAIFFDCDGVPIKEPSLQEVLSAADVKLNRSKNPRFANKLFKRSYKVPSQLADLQLNTVLHTALRTKTNSPSNGPTLVLLQRPNLLCTDSLTPFRLRCMRP